VPDQGVPGIINGHQTPPGVEVDNLDVMIMGTEGVPDPSVPGIRNGKDPPVTNLENLGTSSGLRGRERVPDRSVPGIINGHRQTPSGKSTWTFLIVKTH
jgi:hypothetical protein